jgi:60 kDa SS-A/Ro ribonucleoprotein
MIYATENDLNVDVFVVYTDCETRLGDIPPSQALRQYREHSGIEDAKLIVVAMTSNDFTIADPDDSGMFDMAGFDSHTPDVMREFILGNI